MTEKNVYEKEEAMMEEENAEEENLEENNENKQDGTTNQEIIELNQKLLRVAADFDNFRKRTRTEKEELVKYANTNLICEILPVLDNFQRALEIEDPGEEVKKFLSGMEMIYRQLMQVLVQAGLEPIKALGEFFDPTKHEAVMQVEEPNSEDNSILEELRTGYMFKDKVIRPSMVKVAKN